MPLLFPRAALAASFAVLALGAGTAHGATLNSAHDFNGTLAPSYGDASLTEVGDVIPDTVDGRGVFGFGPPGSEDPAGFSLEELFGLDGTDFSVALTFALDDTDPTVGTDYQRVLDFHSENDDNDGLYVKDGVLSWVTQGEADNSGDTALTGGEPVQVVLVRDIGEARVYLDGALELTVTVGEPVLGDGGLSLFADVDDAEQGSGYLARLRTFDGALTAPEVGSLDALDTTMPGTLQDFEAYYGGVQDGSTLWLGPNSGLFAEVHDDGTAPVGFSTRVLNAGNTQVVAPSPTEADEAFAVGIEDALTQLFISPPLGGLTNNGDYKLETTASDAAGNQRVEVRPFKLDNQAPQGFGIDDLGSTTNTNPTISGTAGTAARDRDRLLLYVCKGDKCDDSEKDFVGFVETAVSGGRWSGKIQTFDEASESNKDLGSIPLGDYVVSGWQSDQTGNFADAERKFKVVAAQAPVVTPPPVVVPPAPPSNQQFAQRLLTNSVAILQRLKLAQLRAKGVVFPVFSDRIGQYWFQIFAQSAPKKVDTTARAAAKKKRKKVKTTRNLIGAGTVKFTAPGTKAVRVKITKKGKRRLKGKSAKLVLRVIFKPATGPVVSADQKVTVKR